MANRDPGPVLGAPFGADHSIVQKPVDEHVHIAVGPEAVDEVHSKMLHDESNYAHHMEKDCVFCNAVQGDIEFLHHRIKQLEITIEVWERSHAADMAAKVPK